MLAVDFLPSSRQIKVVCALGQILDGGFYPTHEGLYRFIKGESMDESLTKLPMFGALVSLGARQGKNAMTVLLRHGYIRQIYVAKYETYYLALTPKGEVLYQEKNKTMKKRQTVKKEEIPAFIPKEDLC